MLTPPALGTAVPADAIATEGAAAAAECPAEAADACLDLSAVAAAPLAPHGVAASKLAVGCESGLRSLWTQPRRCHSAALLAVSEGLLVGDLGQLVNPADLADADRVNRGP